MGVRTRDVAIGLAIGGGGALLVLILALLRKSSPTSATYECLEYKSRALTAIVDNELKLADVYLRDARRTCGGGFNQEAGEIERRIEEKRRDLAAAAAARPPPAPAATAAPARPSGPTWAKIPKPGSEVADTPSERTKYMSAVLTAHPGEPPVNKAKAAQLMEKLRRSLGKQGTVQPLAITPKVGDASGSIKVADGTYARLEVGGRPFRLGVCSEFLLTAAMIDAEASPTELSAAGVRGILCMSDGCTAVFDTRPTAPGGGMYAGEDCLSMEEAMKAIQVLGQ